MQPDHHGESQLSMAVLAKIHLAQKALALRDDEYRDLLERITGWRSARDIEPDQLLDLQHEFRRLGWDGYLLRRDELPPLRYEELGDRPGRPTAKQLRMLEARFVNIKGFAQIAPQAAFRKFLENRFRISDPKLLDDHTYEGALSAVKRLEAERGVKHEYQRARKGKS